MRKPTYYKRKSPLPVSAKTVVKALSAIRSAGLEDDFIEKMNDHSFVLAPETVNFVKDYIFENKVHENGGTHRELAGNVVRSPNGRCP